MFGYFYHEIFRRTIIGFGTLFNNISIQHKNDAGEIIDMMKVPLAYGPIQKFLARLEQSPSLNKPVQITLPRMSFEFIGLSYDGTRKVTPTQTFITSTGSAEGGLRKAYMPVPWNMDFELNIMTKLNDDMLQIIEQILPYFQPSYNMTINFIDGVNEKRDIPIVLNDITMNDDYEGDFSTRRALIYTLRFTAKVYLFGPVSTIDRDIIEKVSIGFMAASSTGSDSKSTGRDLVYSVTPRATQSYSNNVVTNLSKDINSTETMILVNSATALSTGSYINVNNEEMYIKSITDNILTVARGLDNTTSTEHVAGSEVKLLLPADNSKIGLNDEFGFDLNIF